MDNSFWHERWEAGQTGWHQDGGNALLHRHWQALGLGGDERVLVPLCGATPDMAWLAAQGHSVTGVDLSELAAQRFFGAQPHESEQRGDFACFSAGGVEILAGDFFDLPPELLNGCGGLYDRASLIALPPPVRKRYAARLAETLPSGCSGLLITLDYPPDDMNGPPFCVPDSEVQALFSPHFNITLLEDSDALADNAFLRERGVTSLAERAYRLVKR